MSLNFKWYFHRWYVMKHPQEEIYRISQLVRITILDILYNILVRNRKLNKNKIQRYNLNKNILSESINYPVSSSYNFFGVQIENLFTINYWKIDLKNNIKIEKSKIAGLINLDNYEKYGELKYVNELSRFHFLPDLTINAILNNDDDLIEKINELIHGWYKENKIGSSVLWKSGIEVSIRISNIIVSEFIANYHDRTILKKIDSDRFIYDHFYYLTTHLSKYSSANNHFIAELFGIIVITSHYNFSQAQKWLNLSTKWFLEECYRQTFDDGFSREQSVRYHAAVLNMINFIIPVCRDDQIKKALLKKSADMSSALRHFVTEKGEPFNIGDSDDAELIFSVKDTRYNLYLSLMRDYEFLHHTSTGIEYKQYDLRNLIYFGPEIQKTYSLLTAAKVEKICHLPDAGYIIGYLEDFRFAFDYGPLGFGNTCAHGHSDLLSINFNYKSIPIVVDAGTYQFNYKYHAYRKYFRSARAHNTAHIEGFDHSVQSGNMLWQKNAAAKLNLFECKSDYIKIVATFPFPIQNHLVINHSREIIIEKTKISIFDTFILPEPIEKRNANICFHFNPSVKIIESMENNFIIYNEGKNIGKVAMEGATEVQKFVGSTKPLYGWYSEKYDNLVPCTSIVAQMELNKTINKIRSEFTFES